MLGRTEPVRKTDLSYPQLKTVFSPAEIPGTERSAASSLVRAGGDRVIRLQDAPHHVFADAATHLASNPGREPIVKASPDAGIGDLLGQCRSVGPAVGHAGCSRAAHGHFGDV